MGNAARYVASPLPNFLYNQAQNSNEQRTPGVPKKDQWGSEMDAWLRQFFGSDRENANKLLTDASAKYGDLYKSYGGMFDNYGDVAKTGLAGEYDFARKGYRDLAEGWTPVERQEFQAQAVAPTKGMWNAYQMEANRRRAATGGIGPGWDEAGRSAIRQSAFDAGDVGLRAKVQGRQLETGEVTTGLAGETGIAGNINANKLTGMGGQMSALGGQMGATAGIAGVGSKFADMSNADLTALLQSKQISNENIMALLRLRASEPSMFDRIMQIGQFLGNTAQTAAGMG